MELYSLLTLILFCIGASFIQRVTGFGFGIFIMTILPHIMPSYAEATTLSGLLALTQSIFICIKFRKHICWEKLLPLLFVFIITSYIAVIWLSHTDDYVLKKVLGIMLIFVSVYFFFFNDKINIQPNIATQIGLGTISGGMGGFFAMQGPPAVLYFLSTSNNKEQYIAQTQTYFLLGNIMMTIFRAKQGFITNEVEEAWLYAVIAVFAGSFIGSVIFKRLPILTIKRLSYTYMALSGVYMLLQ